MSEPAGSGASAPNPTVLITPGPQSEARPDPGPDRPAEEED
jgi:hypothetical protein